MTRIHARMADLVRSWPHSSGVHAVPSIMSRGSGQTAKDRDPPFWLILPAWLHARVVRDGPQPAPRRFLDDVLWGQVCLFLFIRLQDDVLDGQASSPRLLFVADEFLIESERAFRRHLHDEAFWRFFRSSLQATVRGILEAEARQRRDGLSHDAWHVYAKVSTIFKVASAAVCIRYGLPSQLRRVSRLMDHLAIADQLVDDIRDIEEDLTAGRINAAARWLLGPRPVRSAVQAQLHAAMSEPDRMHQLLDEVRRQVRRARAVTKPLQLAEASAYLAGVEQSVVRMAERLHSARVTALFKSVKKQAGLDAEI